VQQKADKLQEVRSAAMNSILAAMNPHGGLTKITQKASRVAAIGAGILVVLSILLSRTQPTTRLQAVCEALFDRAIFGVEATQVVLNEIYQKYFFKQNREMFAPWKVLRAIDLSAVGGLNYNGIETLRKIECVEKYQRVVLPSRTSVQKATYELHQIGQGLVPFSRKESQHSEMFQYDYERFLCFVLKVFQLDDIAQRESVELSITLDGAKLCDGISHLTAGIKITDGRAIDPQTGVPLCTADDDNFGSIFSNQSRNFCFAIKSLIGKDSKKAYKEFADFFKFFEM
jgi:hypothetical protein